MFRLLWLNIATQMMLLVAAVAGLALFFVSRVTEQRGQELLLERSHGGLTDESLLRGFALREAVRSVRRNVADAADRRAAALRGGDAGERDRAAGQVLAAAEGEEDATRGVVEEVRLARLSADGDLRQIKAFPSKAASAKPGPDIESFDDVRKRLLAAHYAGATTLSRLLLDRQRYLLAVGHKLPSTDPAGAVVVLAVIDFTRLVENQTRRLPRHLLMVQDAEGRWVNHPDPKRVGAIDDEWPQPGGDDQARGVRLESCKLPSLGFFTVRARLPREVGRDLEKELLTIDGLRFSRLREGARYLILSARDRGVLKQAEQPLNVQESLTKSQPAPLPEPIWCETFLPHRLNRFTLDPETGLAVSLTYAAAVEEMTAEAREDMREAKLKSGSSWFLPLVLACPVLALLAAYLLTRPLRRLTEASQRLAQGDYSVDVQVVAPGEVGELARAFRDMTRRIRTRERELRENLARLSTIMTNAADGVITFDQTGRIEDANAAAEEMFGFAPGGLKGMKVQKLMKLPEHLQKPVPFSAIATGSNAPQFGGTVTQLCNAVKTPGEEHRGLRQEGSTFWMEVTFSQVPLEDRRMTIGIFRDITRRKIDEERIRQMNDELDARVRLRTAQLEDTKVKLELALEQAETASAAKDRFISVVSHELRTPLTSAMGYTELLLNPRATKLRENPGPTLDKILTACKYLSTLINDLLDVSRYTAGKPIDLAPTRFELASFLRGVQEMVSPLVKKNGNVLEVAIPPGLGEIYNDETRLRQILLNLLSNAGKFTEKGKVCLTVERRRVGEGDLMVFGVSDTGAGLSPAQQEKLFTAFYRVDNSTTRKQGGTGLGLAITKMLCELMGGGIRLESAPGQGSTFTVTVPAEVTAKGRRSAGPSSQGEEKKPNRGTVLVIDDDPTVRHMLETYLQQEGHEVVLAADGTEGLKLARDHQPTCITLDVLMPDEDGWDVLSRLKNDPATRDIPVIMLTIMEERNRGFALGATEYVTKPIDWGRLGSILCRYNPGQAPILIVEDDALQRGYLREELILAGWTVLEAANGVEALRVCETTTPSLILLDLTMPIMDGFAFLDELRRRDGGTDIPVVVVTARELSDEERRRLNRSVAQVLAKESLSKEKLLDRIREQMQAAVHGEPRTK